MRTKCAFRSELKRLEKRQTYDHDGYQADDDSSRN